MDLRAKRILITRPRDQAEEFAGQLMAHGGVPVFFPVIQISHDADTSALDAALRELDRYDWLVLTSVNGVRAVWERLAVLEIHQIPLHLKVAAIGPKTATALIAAGVQPDFIPGEYVAEAILPGLGDVQGKRVLLLRADLARPALREAVLAAGGMAHEIAVYHTRPARPDPGALQALRAGVDTVTFTSSSTVRNFIALAEEAGLDPRSLPNQPIIACIGPITAQTARESGLPVHLVAGEYTAEGLVQALLDFDARL